MPRPAVASAAPDQPEIARRIRGARTVGELNRRLEEFTHVVVNFRELARFRETFGHDAWFEPDELALLDQWLAGLPPVGRWGTVVAFELPRGAATASGGTSPYQ